MVLGQETTSAKIASEAVSSCGIHWEILLDSPRLRSVKGNTSPHTRAQSEHTLYRVWMVCIGDGIETCAYVTHRQKNIEWAKMVQNAVG